MIDTIQKLIAPLHRRIVNMVARAVVKSVDDAKDMQLLQLAILDTETRDEIERFQDYGFTSNPRGEAEAVVMFVGGKRDHGLAIKVDDRRYRIKNLESGGVAVYNDTGAKIVLRASGDIELTPKAGQKVTIASDVDVTGVLTVSSDVDVTGTVTASTDVVGGGKHLATHTHSVSGANSGGPVVFVPPALTGSPT